MRYALGVHEHQWPRFLRFLRRSSGSVFDKAVPRMISYPLVLFPRLSVALIVYKAVSRAIGD